MGRDAFVHAADLHLDTPFEGVGQRHPDLAALLRDASLAAFDRLVELTLARDAAFLVLAGDLYDGAERGLRAQLRLRDGLARLSDAGVPTFLVHGNHDPVEEGWSAIRSWPERVTVFGSDEVGTARVEVDGEPLATVYGISYPRRAVTENLARRFQRVDAPGLHVGVLHATVGAQPEHAPYSPCSLEDLRAVGLDYWALGHIHRRQILHRGDPWVVYSGNTQGRSPKPSEQGAKGALVVPLERTPRGAGVAEPEFVALDTVRFEEVTVDVAEADDLAAVADDLVAAAERLAAQAEGRALILRGRLIGRGRVHADLARGGARTGLLEGLRDEASTHTPVRWWDRLIDGTRPALDRDALRARPDVTGEVLRLVDRVRADPDALARLGSAAADLRAELERLGGQPAVLTDLLDDAEALALDALDDPERR